MAMVFMQFGDSQKLRSTVIVRVRGGWEPLEVFLQKHDPCQGWPDRIQSV